MKAVFRRVAPYGEDALTLPVENVEAAIPYYERVFGFRVVSRGDAPHKSAVLARDDVRIGLAENGGDSSQEGCFFEVDDIEAAFEEIKGVPPTRLCGLSHVCRESLRSAWKVRRDLGRGNLSGRQGKS